ncbi:MAG: hypothetical protein LAO76_26465 [Acidobacteriia bacterium]|nr:hypothetical protein [Terriglobia bacterium]
MKHNIANAITPIFNGGMGIMQNRQNTPTVILLAMIVAMSMAMIFAALLYGFMRASHASSLEIGAHDSRCLHEVCDIHHSVT